MTMQAVEAYGVPELNHEIDTLAPFRSSRVLDWIETHVPKVNVTTGWGHLAAWSEISWERIHDWLQRGRPLSLVALDAMATCIPRGYVGVHRHEIPKVKGRPDRSFVVSVLQEYAGQDDVPRVEGTVRYVIEHLDEILEA